MPRPQPSADEGVAVERDDRLRQRQRNHVASAAQRQHGQRAAADVDVVHLLDDERAEQEAADDTGSADREDDDHQLA